MGDHGYYKKILNCMNEQVYARDLEMNILYVNPAAQRLSGWMFEASIGKKCYEIFGDEDRKCKDACPVEKAIAENRAIMHHEGEMKTGKGNIRKMKVSISPLEEDGNITGGIVVMQDITDFEAVQEGHVKTLIKMEKMQASLKESELYPEQAQEVAGVGSWHLDIGADVLTWSEQTYRMFGVDRQAALNVRAFMKHVHPEDRPLLEAAWAAALNGAAYDIEHRIVVNTEIRWVHEKAQITFDNDGAPLYGIGTVLDITERRKADRKILQANEEWERTFNSVSDLILLMDNQYRIVRINRAMADKLGLSSPEEAVGENCFECIRGKKEPISNCPYQQLLIDEMEHTGDIFEERLGGNFFATATPIFDSAGKLSESVLIFRDITEQNRAEAQQRFQAQIMSQIHDSVITTDMDGMITSWNKGAENLFHYRAEEIIGKHASVLYPEYSRAYLNNSIVPTLLSKGNHEYETRLMRKEGQEFSGMVSLSVLRDENDKITGLIGYSLDITERVKARKALADSERRLNDIINFLPDPTWVIDIKGRVIAWNQAMARITGIDRAEIIGKGNYAYAVPFYGKPRPVLIDLVLNPDKEWEKEYLSIQKRDDHPIAGEAFIPSMGNGGKYFSGTAARLYNAEGTAVGAIESMRDVTAAKLSERDRDKLIAELQKALAKVRTLNGMLPICASCKKIRDDKGYWNQIESYIRDHSEAEFSHSICPECAQKLYPDLDIYSDDDNSE